MSHLLCFDIRIWQKDSASILGLPLYSCFESSRPRRFFPEISLIIRCEPWISTTNATWPEALGPSEPSINETPRITSSFFLMHVTLPASSQVFAPHLPIQIGGDRVEEQEKEKRIQPESGGYSNLLICLCITVPRLLQCLDMSLTCLPTNRSARIQWNLKESNESPGRL